MKSQGRISKFFSRWFWISILLILVGCILTLIQLNIELDNKVNNIDTSPTIIFGIGLLSELCKVGGVALFVSNIFTFRIDAEDFINYIKNQLRSIVLSKDFIRNLNIAERKDMLRLILRPSADQSNIYSNIDEYFNKYIDESMALFDVIFRSGLVIDIDAKYYQDIDKIALETNIEYRIYKVSEEYEKLPMGFEDPDSKLIETIISASNGDSKKLDSGKDSEHNRDITLATLLEQPIPEQFQKYDHLKVNREIREYGNSEWCLFSYRAMRPCDSLTIKINCDEKIQIMKCITYGKEENFDIKPKPPLNKCSDIRISYNGWLSPGFGVSVLLIRE